MAEMQQGTLIKDRYQLKEYKGSGSFGEVWLAHDDFLDIEVAIKVYISLDTRGVEEFKTEYKTAYGLTHPNLLAATYFDVWQQRPFLVMKYCSNGSAGNMAGNTSEREIWKFIRDVAAGLAYLHAQDPEPIVHQDIKPDNILIDEQGRYLITDFGISKKIRSTMRKQSKRGVAAGAAAYMGPERFSKEPTPIMASDVWSLGASIYELATGELPFCGMGGGMLMSGAELPELDNGKWSKELNTVMQACLAKETWDRPKAQELKEYAAAVIAGAHPRTTWGNPQSKPESQPKPEPKPEPGPYAPRVTHIPNSPQQRHGFVSFWLIVCMIAHAINGAMFASFTLMNNAYEPAFMAIFSGFSIWGLYLLWRWEKWGYWILATSSFISALFYSYNYLLPVLSSAMLLSLISTAISMLILYGILCIKKDGVSTWSQLNVDSDFMRERQHRLSIAGIAVLTLILVGYVRVATSESDAQMHLAQYEQLADECRQLTDAGSNSNTKALISAKKKLEEITEMENKYASEMPEYNRSEELKSSLTPKIDEAHNAWVRAAKSQYEKAGDTEKAIEYYKIALQLKHDANIKAELNSLEMILPDSVAIGYR